MAINELDVLLGFWELTARTRKSDHEDITGFSPRPTYWTAASCSSTAGCGSAARRSTAFN